MSISKEVFAAVLGAALGFTIILLWAETQPYERVLEGGCHRIDPNILEPDEVSDCH